MNPKRHLGRFRAAKQRDRAKRERARTGFWANLIETESALVAASAIAWETEKFTPTGEYDPAALRRVFGAELGPHVPTEAAQ